MPDHNKKPTLTQTLLSNFMPSDPPKETVDTNQLASSLRDIYALEQLRGWNIGFQPWTPSAMAPSHVLLTVNEILINQRQSVLEFGCGISTLYMAAALARTGGSCICIEDNPDWSQLVASWLKTEGLQECVRFVNAPLQQFHQHGKSIENCVWYEQEKVEQALRGHEFDMVVIDAPLANRADRALSRYPAMVVAKPFLAAEHALFLDDLHRQGENDVIRMWSEENLAEMTVSQRNPYLAYGRVGNGFAIGA